ncbi:hypothetical protein [Ensifer canadensis]
MTENITLQISGTPEAVLRFLEGVKQPKHHTSASWWMIETPWFERHGKLTPEEAADLEASTYGTRKDAA